MKVIVFICLLFPVMAIAQQHTQTINNPLFKTVQDSIETKISRGRIPSFSVAVARHGKVIWKQSFGYADKEHHIKASPTTSYALASLSKSITATALMVLVEKGVIRLNDPVGNYLGVSKLRYYRGNASQLRVNHLANMMSGIPHEFEYVYRDEHYEPITIEERIKRYGIVVFEPGTVYNYSNLSSGIIEKIITNITKESLSNFLRASVFKPLGMLSSAVNKSELPNGILAKGYDNKGKLLPESEFYPKAGAGYYASATDLLNYAMFHLKDKASGTTPILDNGSINILHTANTLPNYNKYYSNGWGVLSMRNHWTSLLSNGAIDGAATSLLLLPEQDIAIVCLTNASVGNDFTDQFAFNIANVMLPGYSAALEKYVAQNAPAFDDKPLQPSDSLTGTWLGKIKAYQDSMNVKLDITKEGKLFVKIQDQFETVLNNVITSNGLIHAESFGYLPLPETNGISQYLEWTFKLDKNELFGSVSTQSAFGKRPRFLLPCYISLKKQ